MLYLCTKQQIMIEHPHDLVKQLFFEWKGCQPQKLDALPLSGSDRRYFRLSADNESVIAVFNSDIKENKAFLAFSKSFADVNLSVPKILAQSKNELVYLQEDLGDITLFAHLSEVRKKNGWTNSLTELYKKVLSSLPAFQLCKGVDYNLCYPRSAFDLQSMKWDLSYFKYYFLKLAKIPFDEQLLENDFDTFTNFLLEAKSDFFLYRDFQSRNIMLKNNEIFFIDYQGGRKGALQYDLASLLWDAKANIPNDVRQELLNYYLDLLEKQIPVDRKRFTNYYYGYVLVRIMQALGAYGFRGFYERKTHFLQSIPFALNNLQWILDNIDIPVDIPVLKSLLKELANSEDLRNLSSDNKKLVVRVSSFSYKRTIPIDPSGNGGGFVFDCRGLPNPGREKKYRAFTGKDQCVIDYFAEHPVIEEFIAHAKNIVDISAKNYIERDFASLMISFGCTGGQHRSVFCAEAMAKYLRNKYNVNIELKHIEQELKAKVQ